MPHEFLRHLKEDHKKQMELSKQMIAATDPQQREQLRKEFYESLYPHVVGEEHSMFPFLVKSGETDSKEHALVSLEEHIVAKNSLKEFMKCDPSSDTFKAKAQVLDTLNNHHIQEEEKIDMMALSKLCTKECLDDLFKKYEAAEEKAKGKMA